MNIYGASVKCSLQDSYYVLSFLKVDGFFSKEKKWNIRPDKIDKDKVFHHFYSSLHL